MGRRTNGALLLGMGLVALIPACLFLACSWLDDRYDKFEVMWIFPERLWFQVDHEVDPSFPMGGSHTESTDVYLWEPGEEKRKVFHADGARMDIPIADYRLSETGDVLWVIQPDGDLLRWEYGQDRPDKVCEGADDSGFRMTDDGARVWFRSPTDDLEHLHLYTWRLGDEEPGLVDTDVSHRIWLPEGSERIYYFKTDLIWNDLGTLQTWKPDGALARTLGYLVEDSLKHFSDDGQMVFFTLSRDEGDRAYYAWRLGWAEPILVHEALADAKIFNTEGGSRVWFGAGDPPLFMTWAEDDPVLREFGMLVGYFAHAQSRRVLFIRRKD